MAGIAREWRYTRDRVDYVVLRRQKSSKIGLPEKTHLVSLMTLKKERCWESSVSLDTESYVCGLEASE